MGNKPLTHSDLINEMKMILILNGKIFSEENKEELRSIAMKSVTGRLIKQIELEKYNFDDFNQDDIGKEINKIAAGLNTSMNTLKNSFAHNNVDLSILENRIEIELKWNGLMFDLYKNRVNVNLDVINEQLETIKDQNFIEEYLLYEILIESVEKEKITNENKYNYKMKLITAVLKKLQLSTVKLSHLPNGGKLGWVKETMISERFKKILKETKVGSITKPFLMPEGVLLLKLEEKRKKYNIINLEEVKINFYNRKKKGNLICLPYHILIKFEKSQK